MDTGTELLNNFRELNRITKIHEKFVESGTNILEFIRDILSKKEMESPFEFRYENGSLFFDYLGFNFELSFYIPVRETGNPSANTLFGELRTYLIKNADEKEYIPSMLFKYDSKGVLINGEGYQIREDEFLLGYIKKFKEFMFEKKPTVSVTQGR